MEKQKNNVDALRKQALKEILLLSEEEIELLIKMMKEEKPRRAD